MTNLDPKHLDALDAEAAKADFADYGADLADLIQRQRATITALRAQIDRERAATIEAAAGVCDLAAYRHRDDAARFRAGTDPHHYRRALAAVADKAAQSIRALHTDATRAAMDAIRREGYEAAIEATAEVLFCLFKPWMTREKALRGIRDFTAHMRPELGLGTCICDLAASITPYPDTNADSRQRAAPADGEKLQLSERYQAIYDQACARDALDEKQGLHLRMGGVVEACPICDIAGCHHIRERAAASRQPFAPKATEAECPQPQKWCAGECCGGCLGSSKYFPPDPVPNDDGWLQSMRFRRLGYRAGIRDAARWLETVPQSLPNRQEYAEQVRALAEKGEWE